MMIQSLFRYQRILIGPALTALTLVSPLRAQMVEFYIGIDGRQQLVSGPYAGKPNPNAGRLTFFYAHAYAYVPGLQPPGQSAFNNNHYHGISAYSLSGPVDDPVVLNTNANSRIPETFTGQPPLTLVPATEGLYAGKLVNARTAEHFSNPSIQSVWWLNDPSKWGPGSPEWVMFRSSGGTRTNSLEGAVVALELVGRSEGLHIGSAEQMDLLVNPGDRHVLGDGNQIDFSPVCWVEGEAPEGHYWASFKLVDVGNGEGYTPFGESGIYWFDYRVAGTPALEIAATVNLTMPLVSPGYILEAAPSPDGPWEPVTPPPGVIHGSEQTLTLPAASTMQVFRLRKP